MTANNEARDTARKQAWNAISPDDRDGLDTFNHGFDAGYSSRVNQIADELEAMYLHVGGVDFADNCEAYIAELRGETNG